MERRQRGRHVVVTGASSGIGRAIAARLAAEGARVTVMSRRTDGLAETARACRDAGGEVHVQPCDVRDAAAVDAAFEGAVAAFGPLYACVANAGVGGPNAPGPDDRFDELVATNLTGTYRTLRAAERRLHDGPAHLVATSSILGRFGVAGYTGYCASKTAILGLVRALAHELAPRGVQVNALVPGWVETDMAWQGLDGMARALGTTRDEAWRLAMREVPLRRMSRPEDVAGVVAWLLSDDARGVTGQGIDVNNGAWMG